MAAARVDVQLHRYRGGRQRPGPLQGIGQARRVLSGGPYEGRAHRRVHVLGRGQLVLDGQQVAEQVLDHRRWQQVEVGQRVGQDREVRSGRVGDALLDGQDPAGHEQAGELAARA